jgi:hypothetical protein
MAKDCPVVTETVRAEGPAMVLKGPEHGPWRALHTTLLRLTGSLGRNL